MRSFLVCLSFVAFFAVDVHSQSGELQTVNGRAEAGTESFIEGANVSYMAGYLEEDEEAYGNSTIFQKLSFGKGFSDLFRADLNIRLDYSRREQTGEPVRERWFDNTKLSLSYDPTKVHHFTAFAGASISDTTFTGYGGTYRAVFEVEGVVVENTLEGGYDYFYYWNQVGQDFISETIELKYTGLNLTASYFYASVRENYVDGYDIQARNPNDMFNLGLSYDIMQSPKLNAGLYYQTRNYEYYSPLYYSPQDRWLTGFGAYYFDTFGKFFLYAGAGIKRDNNKTVVWSADGEFGYENDGFSLSAGGGEYDDPYYRSMTLYLNLTKKF